MYIIMNIETAQAVTGMYGLYDLLSPCDIGNGQFALPASVLNNPIFDSVHELLRGCAIVDTIEYPQEVEDV